MIAPNTLNGYPVILATRHPSCVTVVVDRKSDYPTLQRYVVATWWPDLGTTWSWGHYVDTTEEALLTCREVENRNRMR